MHHEEVIVSMWSIFSVPSSLFHVSSSQSPAPYGGTTSAFLARVLLGMHGCGTVLLWLYLKWRGRRGAVGGGMRRMEDSRVEVSRGLGLDAGTKRRFFFFFDGFFSTTSASVRHARLGLRPPWSSWATPGSVPLVHRSALLTTSGGSWAVNNSTGHWSRQECSPPGASLPPASRIPSSTSRFSLLQFLRGYGETHCVLAGSVPGPIPFGQFKVV